MSAEGNHTVVVLALRNRDRLLDYLRGAPRTVLYSGAPVRIRDTSKKQPKIVDTSKPAERVDVLKVAKALGADDYLDPKIVEDYFVAGANCLHLVFSPSIRLRPQTDYSLEFGDSEKVRAYFGEKTVVSVYILETREIIWPISAVQK